MTFTGAYWLQQLINLIQLAAFYAPLAAAFALIQGITRRVFLSFGDMAMFASFAAIYGCYSALVDGYGDWTAAAIALAAALACGAALGGGIARGIFGRSLIAHNQAFMIASIGLAIALQEAMRIQSLSRDIWVPPLFQGVIIAEAGGAFPLKLSLMTALAVTVSAAAMAILFMTMRWTRIGREWRACTQSIELARLCGLDTDRVIVLSFAMAAALAGVSGWTSAISYGGTNFTIGLMLGFKAMFASVVGGFGSLRGAAMGAVFLAAVEVAWSALFSTAYRDVAVFGIIILILLLKPEGIAGVRDRRESEAI